MSNDSNVEFIDGFSKTLVFFVNGRKIVDDCVDPEWTLLQYLRIKLHIFGTKLGCGEGGCGACTVMVSRFDRESNGVINFSVNACLCPVASLHGTAVVTVEGIGSSETKLHPVQERIAKSHGSQCGFCTPGFVMSMYTLLRNNPEPTMQQIEENLAGNLCRCTGYRPILDGFRTFSKGCGLENCCQLQPSEKLISIGSNDEKTSKFNDGGITSILTETDNFIPYDPTQDPIFPPELKKMEYLDGLDLRLEGPRVTFYRPTTLSKLLGLKRKFPHAKLSAGNTEIGVETKFKKQHYPILINPVMVAELSGMSVAEEYLVIGSCTTLSYIEENLENLMSHLPEFRFRIPSAILEMLKWFAGRQIRNVATIGGNIVTGSPISDLLPILMAAGSTLQLQSEGESREVALDDNFFTGYRRHVIRANEVLISIKIPLTSSDTYFYGFKQARRKEDDIAIVNSGMVATFEENSIKIQSIRLCFGGMAATTIFAKNTMQNLIGMEWNKQTLDFGVSSLLEEMKLNPSVPGGMADFRCSLTASFFFKFFLMVQKDLNKKHPSLIKMLPADENITVEQPYTSSKSTQVFQRVPSNQPDIDPIGRPIVHMSAIKQATGEAGYLDDIPCRVNELHAALVTSTKAKAKIAKLDESKALAIPGVELVLSAKNVPEERNVVAMFAPEEAFAKKEVICVGQIIAMVVAHDQATAKRAANLVEVTYEDVEKPVVTIEDAIASNSLLKCFETNKGDPDKAFKNSIHILEGTTRLGGQEHFYMETHGALAIPHDGGEMEIISSSQNVTENALHAAYALGIPANHVVAKVKRIGGGFGGKETRSSAFVVPAALAAKRLNRPVRLILDRDEDMLITGGRHPVKSEWKVGFSKDGFLQAVDIKIYVNIGCTADISEGVITRALFSIANGYSIPNARVMSRGCLTNLPSNTAFRGFGTPQAAFIMEDIMDSISEHLKADSSKIRDMNLTKPEGGIATFGQKMDQCTLRQCWKDCIEQSNFYERQKIVKDFNKNHKYRKRGLAIVPTKFCIGFGVPFLNKGGALVNIYHDGSVLVSTGGMEMGQGLFTKMIQVASRVLKVPIEKVHILESATDKIPNSSPTAASMSSDLYGMAVLSACTELLKRLEPYIEKNPAMEWEELVRTALMDRVNLSATGFYKVPNLETYDYKNSTGNIFSYFTYGVGATEVEIDCITGDHSVIRTDIVMDVGESLNPAIDIGQIEGAFAQGLGLYTIEELLYSPEGSLITRGPGAYKIPSVGDIPREFNVTLLRGSSNPKAVYSSKAVGEPPLALACSAFFAIKEAIRDVRGNGSGPLRMTGPATAEKIRNECKDFITEQVKTADQGTFKPWSINVF